MKDQIGEAFEFARAIQKVAQIPGAVDRLITAVSIGEAEEWAVLLREFKLERYCVQLCHWICWLRCQEYCVLVCPPDPTIPLFTHVGNYDIYTNFNADGTTTVGNLAFTSVIPLKGILPDGSAPDALEYRFTYEKYPLGAPAQKTAGMIKPFVIGELEYYEWNSALSMWQLKAAEYWVNNPGAQVLINQPGGTPIVVSLNQTIDPDGWIKVPQNNDLVFGGSGKFIPDTGVMAALDTTQLSSESFDLKVAVPPLPLKAGDAVPAANKSQKPLFKINFEARKVGTTALLSSNSLNVIAISNTDYKYIRHLDWAGGPVETVPVVSIDIQELVGASCSPLSGSIHAQFTAYHPYLGSCSVWIEGPGVPPPAGVNPAISADGQAISPAGGQIFDISSLQPCAYILWISTTLRLTNGVTTFGGPWEDHLAFCIR